MATIQGVYLALFGRPADPLGLSFFNAATNNGANLAGIGPLQSSAEYTARFAGQTNAQIINSIYKSLFNRDADLPGLTFFADALAKGTLSIANIAIAIYDGAQGADKTIRDLKEAAANAFTAALDTAPEVVGYAGTNAAASAAAFIAGVTTTAPTAAAVDAAVAAAVASAANGAGVVGVTLGLTAGGTDIIGPNSATAALKSTANDDTVISTTATHLATGDIVDLGGGADTLKAVLDDNAKPTLTSIETVQIQFITNANKALDVSGSTGIKTLVSDSSGVNGVFDKVALGTAVTFSNQAVGGTVNFASATGAADSATFTVSKVTAGTITADAIETINVVSAGGANTVKLTGNAVQTVAITGDKALTLDLTGDGATLKTVTSTSTAAVTINAGTALTEKLSVTLGGGADTLTTTGATKQITANLGAGADTINFDAGKASQITGGADADTFKIDAKTAGLAAADITTAAKLAAAVDVITDFTSGADKINVTAGAATVTTLSGTQLATVAGQADLLAAVNSALSVDAAAAAKETIAFKFGADTYLVVNNDADNALSAGDNLIKLTGVATLVAADFTVA